MDKDAIIEEMKINEEYKTWKKHAAYLYDLMYWCVPLLTLNLPIY